MYYIHGIEILLHTDNFGHVGAVGKPSVCRCRLVVCKRLVEHGFLDLAFPVVPVPNFCYLERFVIHSIGRIDVVVERQHTVFKKCICHILHIKRNCNLGRYATILQRYFRFST